MTDGLRGVFGKVGDFNVVMFRRGKMMECGGKVFVCQKGEMESGVILKGEDD